MIPIKIIDTMMILGYSYDSLMFESDFLPGRTTMNSTSVDGFGKPKIKKIKI